MTYTLVSVSKYRLQNVTFYVVSISCVRSSSSARSSIRGGGQRWNRVATTTSARGTVGARATKRKRRDFVGKRVPRAGWNESVPLHYDFFLLKSRRLIEFLNRISSCRPAPMWDLYNFYESLLRVSLSPILAFCQRFYYSSRISY